jgi:ribosome-associated protein
MEFEVRGEYIELNKLLKLLGYVETGGEANSVISDGEVKLNGVIETQKRKKIRKGDSIMFNNELLKII